MLVFRSSFADWNSVPTGSMKPTIDEGDRILVNKKAYDQRVPFTHISLLHLSDP
ncbi:S26 family signal peptidase, partial [Saccharophagus degradans]|nr:S26 family signal peptidase [Saccharophagus degradans]